MIAAMGIASRIPMIPHIRLNTIREIRIQIDGMPSCPPNSFGLMIYPSTVWRAMVKIRNPSAYHGLIRNRIRPPITAPRIGPKVGARLVTPTMTEISGT